MRGKHKYVIVFGTVISGLGKGIFSSSLAKLLKDKNLAVAPIKMEGYLNIDSGTLNPYRHGEVFVLDDGLETDMDLGTYERMLDQNLTRENYITSGQIYRTVLDKRTLGRLPRARRPDDPARHRRGEVQAPRTGDATNEGRTSSSSRSAARSATTRTRSTSRPCVSSPSRKARAASATSR